MHLTAALIFTLFLLNQAFAAKQGPTAIALMSIETRGIVDGNSIGVVQERLRNLLLARENIQVAPLSQSEEYLAQNRISLPSLCKEDCKKKMGSSLNVSYLLVPTMSKEPYGLAISLDLFDVKTEKVVASAKSSTQGELSGALSQSVQALMDGSPNLASTPSKGLSETTWTILGVGGSVLLIGGLVLLNGMDDSEPQSEKPVENKQWNDAVELR